MTYKEIMEHIKFHRERIDELSDRLHSKDLLKLTSTDRSEVRKDLINEMMWRAEEIGKLDTCNKKRLITNLENFRKKIGF